jgi:hypothetical protein
VDEDMAGYIKEWRESLTLHKIPGLILHDNLSDEFVNENTNDYISFLKVPEEIYNACDARWVVYDKFIKENGHKYDWIFATDVSDVIVGKNPFVEDLELYGKKLLFSGDETASYNSGWIKDRNKDLIEVLPEVYNHVKDNPKLKLFNPGIIGGSTEIMKEYFSIMADLVIKAGPIKRTVDMPIHNYVVRTHFANRVKHGSPVNSIFFKLQKERKDVWFIHK